MPTRKTSGKSVKKSSSKAISKGKGLDLQAVKAGRVVLYGIPIRDAIKRGDLKEMKQLAVLARSHVKDVASSLAALEKAIGK